MNITLIEFLLIATHFALGILLGVIFFRSDFCMAGMFRDLFLFRKGTLFRSLLLCCTVTMLLFWMARQLDLVPFATGSISSASLITLAGGVLFGIGMVFAGGCAVGILYKMATGHVTSTVAFAGMLLGSVIYADIRDYVVSLHEATIIIPENMAEVFGFTDTLTVFFVIVGMGPLFIRWYKNRKWHINAYADEYLQPWIAALLIAAVNLCEYVIIGWPLGITTAYAKLAGMLEYMLIPMHTETLSYYHAESLSSIISNTVYRGGAGPRFDLISLTEIPLMVGIVAGSFFSALRLGEFRIHGMPPLRQLVGAVSGGILIAMGARLAQGCNLKYVLGGLPLFTVQAFVFTFGMLAGAAVGAAILRKLIINTEVFRHE